MRRARVKVGRCPMPREEALSPQPPPETGSLDRRLFGPVLERADTDVATSWTAPLSHDPKSWDPRATALGGGPGGKASWRAWAEPNRPQGRTPGVSTVNPVALTPK